MTLDCILIDLKSQGFIKKQKTAIYAVCFKIGGWDSACELSQHCPIGCFFDAYGTVPLAAAPFFLRYLWIKKDRTPIASIT